MRISDWSSDVCSSDLLRIDFAQSLDPTDIGRRGVIGPAMFELNQTLVAAANQAREQRHELQAPASRLDSVRNVRELIGADHMTQLQLGLEEIAVHGRHGPEVETQAKIGRAQVCTHET